jgi:integrase
MQAKSYESASVRLSTEHKGRKRRVPVWVGRYRLAGKDSAKVIGKAWTKRSRPPRGFLTRTDAAEELRRFLEREGARLSAAGGVSFGTVADAYIANLEARIEAGDFRASTLRSYRNIIERDLRPEWSERPIDTITREEVAAYRTRLAKRGLAAGTMNQHRAIVRGMFALAVRNYGLEGSPAVGFQWTRSRRATSGAISFYRPDEVQRLAEHAGSEQDAAIFVTAAFTGLRASELRNLRWRSVDFADSLVHVERGYTDEGGEQLPKSYKVRSVPLMPQVAAVLSALRRRDYFATEDDLVFVNVVGTWIDRSALYRRYKAAQSVAGLRELRLHDLRHSFGTMAVRAFPITDVQTWMGHADIATTRKFVHYAPQPDAAKRLGALVDEQLGAVVPIRPAA